MTKQEIRETFEDIQFCLKKLEEHARACDDPSQVGFIALAFGMTLNESGFSDNKSKFFNFGIGDTFGLLSAFCTMIDILDNNGIPKETLLEYVNNMCDPDEHFDLGL